MRARARAVSMLGILYDGYFDCFASFVNIISQYSFVVRCRIVHCSGNLRLAARGFFARMCAFSMCAHVSLRAHRRRVFASWASFQTWNPHCHYSIDLYIYTYVCVYFMFLLYCFVVQDSASWRQLVGICCARVFGAHVRRNGSASSMCAHVRAQFPSLESYDGYFDCFASFVNIISQYSFVVRCRIVHCSGNLRLAARGFFARMCAFSMCAHVSLRAHRRRALGQFPNLATSLLGKLCSIIRVIYF